MTTRLTGDRQRRSGGDTSFTVARVTVATGVGTVIVLMNPWNICVIILKAPSMDCCAVTGGVSVGTRSPPADRDAAVPDRDVPDFPVRTSRVTPGAVCGDTEGRLTFSCEIAL